MALSLVKRAFNALRTRPEDPQGTVLQYIGPNNAGVKVTPEIALTVSAVWACIDCVASSIASSDWNVYAGSRGLNNQQYLPEDGLQYILNTRANSEMTAQAAKRALMIAALGWGNGYAEIVRDMAGRVAEWWPLPPDRCELKRGSDYRPFLRVYNDGTEMTDLNMRDVFHIRGPGISGLLGDNTFAKAVQTIAMSVALDQFAGAYFANGTQMGLLIEYPGAEKLDDPTYNRLKEAFETRHKGARKAFKFGVAWGGMKVHQLNVEAEKAQMIEARYQQIEEVCRWFRVPPHKIAHLLRATNNNIEHQGLEFSRDTLRPWKVEIEQEADYKLVSNRQKKFICIDTDWAAEGDFKSRMEGYRIGRDMGVYSANDILIKLGENTIGKEGDLRIVNGAAIPLERVGENYPQNQPREEPEEDTEIIEAWVRSVYSRISSMVANRKKEYAKMQDGNRLAEADAIEYMTKPLAELSKIENKLPGFMAKAHDVALMVVKGKSPDEAAAHLMESLSK